MLGGKTEANKKNKIIIWGILYWIVLTLSFLRTIQTYWEGYLTSDFSISKYILATILMLGMLFSLPREESLSTLFLLIILYLVIFPMGITYSCQNRETIYFLSVVAVTIFIELTLPKITLNTVKIRIGMGNPSIIVTWLMIVLLIFSIFIMYRERGIPNILALDLSLTYEIRSSYRLSSSASDLFNYATKAIIPFLIATCFFKKHYKLIVVLMSIQFLFFLWLAHKTTIFSLAIFVFGYFVAKMKYPCLLFSKVFVIGLSTLTLLKETAASMATDLSRVINLGYSLIVRRTIFEPSLLKFCYYDYFVKKENPKTGLFGTVIAPVLTRIGLPSPYSKVTYSKIIGTKYLDGSNANTGLFGDEVAHFGYLGIIVAGLLLLIFMLCVKRSERANGKIFTCCLTLYLVFGFADSGVIQIINFSPMLLIVVILYFYNLQEHQLEESCKAQKFRFVIRYK
jgi:hypothetical protein